MKVVYPLIFASLLAVILVSGCAVNTTAEVPQSIKSEVLSYSTPIAQNILVSLNSGNYDTFSENFSQKMKSAIDNDGFVKLMNLLRASVGKFVSLNESGSIIETGGYYVVTYKAQFTDDDPVNVIVSFGKNTSVHIVEGLFFNSKKLSGNL